MSDDSFIPDNDISQWVHDYRDLFLWRLILTWEGILGFCRKPRPYIPWLSCRRWTFEPLSISISSLSKLCWIFNLHYCIPLLHHRVCTELLSLNYCIIKPLNQSMLHIYSRSIHINNICIHAFAFHAYKPYKLTHPLPRPEDNDSLKTIFISNPVTEESWIPWNIQWSLRVPHHHCQSLCHCIIFICSFSCLLSTIHL